MPCPRAFDLECRLWTSYLVLCVIAMFVGSAIGMYLGLDDWQIVAKTVIAVGATSCVFWWLWVMKKIRDIACWWIDLRTNLDAAAQALAEARQDIKEIKTFL